MLPPNTTSRPSAVKVWPAHQMLAGLSTPSPGSRHNGGSTRLVLPVAGSQSHACAVFGSLTPCRRGAATGSWDTRTTSPCRSAAWPRGCPSPESRTGRPSDRPAPGVQQERQRPAHSPYRQAPAGVNCPARSARRMPRMFGRVLGPQRSPLERTQLALAEPRHTKLTTRMISPGRRRARREGQERERRCGDSLSAQAVPAGLHRNTRAHRPPPPATPVRHPAPL